MAHDAKLVRFTSFKESASGVTKSSGTSDGRRVYKDVTIIKAGLGNMRDRHYYPAETLERQVSSGAFDGLRAYADHQDSLSEEVQPERTIRDMVGVYDRPRFVREGKGGGRVVADLHLFRSSKWLSDTVDDLIDLGHADRIGLSINGRGKTVEKRMQLEESADPIDVNYVEDFLALRSADVVTEAGAGGGFQQLLESARGSLRKETDMKRLSETQQKAIKAATDANDMPKLAALMQECGLAPVAEAKKKKDDADADDADVAEADEAEDADAALDAEAERIKEQADGEDAADDADANDDTDDLDGEDDGEDVDEADGDEAEEADTKEATDPLKGKGAGKLIAGRPGGRHGGALKGAAAKNSGGGSFVKPGKGAKGAQAGRRFGEADVQALARQNERLREDNARLASQLRIRTTTDRARKLLRESAIPAKLQPEILRLMVGKSEGEMAGVIRYHERMVEAAIDEVTNSGVEGAGSRMRESHHGGGERFDQSMLDGLPLKG